MSKPVVYLAGKIAKKDWRCDVLSSLRPGSVWEEEKLFDAKYTEEHADFLYGGPFFYSCDHGCAHAPGRHGAVTLGCESMGSSSIRRNRARIWEVNCERIRRSDLVFFYINEVDCFGTLIELGFACADYSVRLSVCFGFALDAAMVDDMWMACMPVDPVSVHFGSPGAALSQELKLMHESDWPIRVDIARS